MNLNPLATAALVMIGIAQVWQAWTALQPTPQETHFRVVQEFCKGQAQGTITFDKNIRHYIECMSQHAQKAFLLTSLANRPWRQPPQVNSVTPRNARYGIYEAILPYICGTGVLSQAPSIELQSLFGRRRDRRARIYCG